MRKAREGQRIADNLSNSQIEHLIDEWCINPWLIGGVPDGDIEYGDLATDNYDDEFFLENKNFSELMELFLRIMKLASYSGGLYCDGVVSK